MPTKGLLRRDPNLWLIFTQRSGVLKKGAAGHGGTVGSEEQRGGSLARLYRRVPL